MGGSSGASLSGVGGGSRTSFADLRSAARLATVVGTLVGVCLQTTIAQHTTIFTAPAPGGVRETGWSGVIAYTSFEESTVSSAALGGGSLYTDGVEAAECNQDHELAANSGQAQINYQMCSVPPLDTIYRQLGYRVFYETRPESTVYSDGSGMCDGDDLGIVGDATTAQAAISGTYWPSAAPDGSKYYMIEDPSAGFTFVEIDAVDTFRYSAVSVSGWVQIGTAGTSGWEAQDM
eukprot:SAG22_NODE_2842_length_2162_cov_1.607853_1_plen_233_part_10